MLIRFYLDWCRSSSYRFYYYDRAIRREEGIRALWKGLGPNLVGIVPARSIYFSCYSKGKEFYTNLNGGSENSLVHTASAVTAGSCTALCTNPIWLVKTRMQLQSEAAIKNSKLVMYKSSWDCLRTVVRNEGFFGLYNGMSASLLGLTESTLQFVMYEHFKGRIIESKLEAGEESPSISKFFQDHTMSSLTTHLSLL